ncbi:hypothetical protein L2X99_14945 [Microbacterium sp. KUDC0406]|uniref:hypothetical protein n=1 Tax=Microbacterium sp. KUDC0406 TaxID=2909588 RepID=UPI001F1EA877|nr:hypothetical protein [Microbacterium sp. KUDC0406]UJP09686.1 hypothetical protein L2X99_14945 [Microbacterium sp. KUDC0406]
METVTEYTPGVNTSRFTGSRGAASAPAIATWRRSSSKPFTAKTSAPRTTSSISASGLFANRQLGVTPTHPSCTMSNVVVPSWPAAR